MIDLVRNAIIFDDPSSSNAQAMRHHLEDQGYSVEFGGVQKAADTISKRAAMFKVDSLASRRDLIICAPNDDHARIDGEYVDDLLSMCEMRTDRRPPVVLYPSDHKDSHPLNGGELYDKRFVQVAKSMDEEELSEARVRAIDAAIGVSQHIAAKGRSGVPQRQ